MALVKDSFLTYRFHYFILADILEENRDDLSLGFECFYFLNFSDSLDELFGFCDKVDSAPDSVWKSLVE